MHNSDKYKSDIYKLLEEMSENINKLFFSLGIQNKQTSDLQIPPRIIALIESVVNSGGRVSRNLDMLNDKLKMAFEKSEEIRLINWAKDNNLNEVQNDMNQMNQELFKLKSQVEEMRQQKNLAEKACLNLQNELDVLGKKYRIETVMFKKQYLNSLLSLISLRDGLLMKEGLAESQGESKLHSALTAILEETANMLEKNQVTILGEMGNFDSSTQTVVDVQGTDDETLHNTIASVFRPGYRFTDEMIRPQEVVLYKYKRS